MDLVRRPDDLEVSSRMDLVRCPDDLEVSSRRRVWVGRGEKLEAPGHRVLRIGLAGLLNLAGIVHLLGVLIFAGCVRVRLVGKCWRDKGREGCRVKVRSGNDGWGRVAFGVGGAGQDIEKSRMRCA